MNLKMDVILPMLISFFISVLLSPVLIPFLKKLKFGQYVREDGPESHLKKAGTPTMGGLIFLISIVVTSAFYIKDFPYIIPVLFSTLGFGFVGFIDDYIKVVMKRSMGLHPGQKMLGQFIITAVLCVYLAKVMKLGTDIRIPFTDISLELGVWYYVLAFIVVLGTVNGANFTDGLDGLASSVTVLIATFFTVVAIGYGVGITPITSAAVGSLLGFLVFNVYPARVFMGDTGSLALGGFVASTALVLKQPLIIVIVAFIYLFEVISVIIQVAVYKKTKKRVFRMAPIHHHFELGGWPETKVVAIFSIVTAVLCLVGFLAV
jgi:phospho-N-acetylmuramoyl-pentapeptide-transferase